MSEPAPSPDSTALWLHRIQAVIRGILIGAIALVALQLLRQAWILGQPVPVVAVPSSIDTPFEALPQLADAEGFWTAGESQVGLRIVTVTAEELERQFQLASHVPKTPPAEWEMALIKWVDQQAPKQAALDGALKEYQHRSPEIWYRLSVTAQHPLRVCLAQIAWPSSQQFWLMAQIIPVPGVQKNRPAPGLIPITSQVVLAQRWNHKGELTGELVQTPSHWSKLRAQWEEQGYRVQTRQGSEEILAGSIEVATLWKSGQPSLLALHWGQQTDKPSLLAIVTLKSVETGEP